jgi:fused signal recognition particle receptor
MSGGNKKPGLWQRLFGHAPKEEEEGEAPRAVDPKEAVKGPPPAGPKEMSGEAPPEERPPEAREKGEPPRPPEEGGPHSPKPRARGDAGKRKAPARKKKDTGAADAPPPAGPASPSGATSTEERRPGTREKGEPDASPTAPTEEPSPKKKDQGSASLRTAEKRGWLSELRQGLSRSTAALGDNLTSVFSRRKLDEESLDDLEDALIKSDLGVAMAARIRAKLASGRYDRGISPDSLREVLAAEVSTVLEPVAKPLEIPQGEKPHVMLIVGVNGTGKTTTAAKLAHRLIADGKTVLLAAADTFRAAAIDQLKVWGARVGTEVVAKDVGADPAGVAFEALERAKSEARDVLIVDTAGRLQNKSDLMAELAKIVRVLKKLDPDAPHGVLLVLDATTGQNALAQVDIFREIAGVTGLVLTKIDGTARGGILVAIAERFGLPVHAIGIGEGVDDLRPFDANDFARAIAGLDVKNARAA